MSQDGSFAVATNATTVRLGKNPHEEGIFSEIVCSPEDGCECEGVICYMTARKTGHDVIATLPRCTGQQCSEGGCGRRPHI